MAVSVKVLTRVANGKGGNIFVQKKKKTVRD